MAEKKEKKKEEQTALTKFQTEVTDRSRDIWLAGLGAFATVEDEGNKFFNTLVTKGKEREEKGRKQLDKVYDKVRKSKDDLSEQVKDLAHSIDTRFEAVLDRVGIPTRKEVEELMNKVDKLSDQVNKLSENLGKKEKTEKKEHTAKTA